MWISAIDTHTQRHPKDLRVCCSAPDLAAENSAQKKLLESTTMPMWSTNTKYRNRLQCRTGAQTQPYRGHPNANNNKRPCTQPEDGHLGQATSLYSPVTAAYANGNANRRTEAGWQEPQEVDRKRILQAKFGNVALSGTDKTLRDSKTALDQPQWMRARTAKFWRKSKPKSTRSYE